MSGILQRADFSNIKKKYGARGKKNVRLTESSLVLIQPIEANKTNYIFPVLDNQGTPDPEEKRLNINDEFIITKCGVYLLATVFDETAPVPNSAQYWLSCVPLEMGAVNIVLQPLYNGGTMSIDVNTINYISDWDIKKHEYRGVTQFQNSSVGQPFATLPSVKFDESGMVGMTPMVTLSGAKKNDIVITVAKSLSLPPSFALQTVNGVLTFNINKIAIVYRGFLAQNASNFQGVKSNRGRN